MRKNIIKIKMGTEILTNMQQKNKHCDTHVIRIQLFLVLYIILYEIHRVSFYYQNYCHSLIN